MSTESQPMGIRDTIKAVVQVVTTRKLPNPLAGTPKDTSRAALVKELNDWWMNARKFWEPVFKEIEEDMIFAGGKHWPDGVLGADGSLPYQADVTQRHLMQKEAQLYAKNPTFEARRRERLEFEVWDETEESLNGARAILQQYAPQIDAAKAAKLLLQHVDVSVMPPKLPPGVTMEHIAAAQRVVEGVPPEVDSAQMIIDDHDRGMKQRAYEEAFGNTLRLLFQNQLDAQNPPFKQQGKQLITRVNTCKVGYVKLLMRRELTGTPTSTAIKTGPAELLASIRAKVMAMSEPDAKKDSGDLAELEMMFKQLKSQQDEQSGGEVDDEGVVFDFLPATSVIVDPYCRNLRGFVGCQRICHEMLMSVADVEREFNISLRDTGVRLYSPDGKKNDNGGPSEARQNSDGETPLLEDKALVGFIYDRTSGNEYVVCDGVKDFLREPKAPEPDWDFFWPILPLVFRPIEVEKNDPKKGVTCYPKSDVRLLRPMQKEKNRSGQEFIEARIASRAWWVGVASKFQKGDLDKLRATRKTNEVILAEMLAPGEKLSDFLMAGPVPDVKPEVFNDARFDQDILEVTGSQQADLGPTNDDTATQSRIAAQSRLQSSDSNIDDLEDFFTMLAKGAGILLMTMRPETVKRKIGTGAVWPDLTMQQYAENVWLQVQAGSSGPPNRQLDLEISQRVLPLLTQLPGISPELIAKLALRAVDPRMSLADFYSKAFPSIAAMNSAAGAGQKQAPVPPPKASINYKDAPPSIQRQMEQAEGYKPAEEMTGTVHMDALKKEPNAPAETPEPTPAAAAS